MVRRVQGFDAILIVSQILTLQTFHYLLMTLLVPPLLSAHTYPVLLDYSGGARTVGYVLDWREMAGRSTAPSSRAWDERRARAREGLSGAEGADPWAYDIDDRRGWIIAGAWLIVSLIDIAPLYYLIRKPTLILDFSLSLAFIHLLATIFYSHAFPTSFFFWLVLGTGSLAMIVLAEQLCVRREMKDGLGAEWDYAGYDGDDNVIELSERR